VMEAVFGAKALLQATSSSTETHHVLALTQSTSSFPGETR
jgi:hypothetical protein